MAKKKDVQEEEVMELMDVADEFEIAKQQGELIIERPTGSVEAPQKSAKVEAVNIDGKPTISCLRKERVIARLIMKKSPMIKSDKHVLDGGMAQNSTRTFTVPRLRSGQFAKVLTDEEEAYLEDIMGLEPKALSAYKQRDNYWSNNTPNAINTVTLHKQDNYFDLSVPEDYIRVKILLANKQTICPSLEEFQNMPKESYQFILIRENEEVMNAKSEMDNIQRCYMEYGKYSTNVPVLRHIIESFEGKQTAPTSKLEFLQTRINSIIQKDQKQFLAIIDDPYMLTKVLIKRATEAGIVVRRGTHYLLRDGNLPLCSNNEEPTLSVAAKFLNLPKNQSIKFNIEQKLDAE